MNQFFFRSFLFLPFNSHTSGGLSYRSISAAKPSEPAAGRNTGLPFASVSTTSLRLQSVVCKMKLHICGTSISTCVTNQKLFILSYEQKKNKKVNLMIIKQCYLAGGLGSILELRGPTDGIQRFSFILVFIFVQGLVSLGH